MKLAIKGGKPVRTEKFPAYRIMGDREKEALCRVIDSGVLSRFLGVWHDDFYGGPEVQAVEREWAAFLGVKHAISVNSCTSALYCAVGATGVEPGEEIIVSPYTMSASATAPLVYNAVPVFADIEEDHYCLDPDSVESRITSRTRAIIVVDIFGQPYDRDRINHIAQKHGLYVIEDCAQAPGATWRDKKAGTLGHMGCFSLNYHKHIHTGEGGFVVTDDDELAMRVRLIRNHAEAVVEKAGRTYLNNMIGFNYRMTELEASVARCQLDRLPDLLEKRQENCLYLNDALGEIPAIKPTLIRPDTTHAFYVHPLKFDRAVAGVDRDTFIEAVKAELPLTELREGEGVKVSSGYCKPLYLQPMFQNKMAYGSGGCPFVAPWYDGEVDYSKGICPVTERMYGEELFLHELMRPPMTKDDLDDVLKAFWKVWDNREELQ